MQLTHHSPEAYETRKARMANSVRSRFEKTIAEGRQQCQAVLEQLDRERPTDRVVPGKRLKFLASVNGVDVMVGDDQETIHDNALTQFAGRVKLPMTYVRQLEEQFVGVNGAGDWARELLAHNLNTLYQDGRGAKGRYLLRSVNAETRACLSDHYRRLDCRPLLQAFYEAAIVNAGGLPTRGYSLPTKTAIRVVLPTVFEPIPNEPMLYGLEWHNSDYGHGTHSMRAFVHRPWCTNEATCDDVLRQIHLGKRLEDDYSYSEKTYMLDQATSVAALSDVVKGLLQPAAVDKTMGMIAKAHDAKVSAGELGAWMKANLTKGEAERVTEAFNSPDIENLPPGNTMWRLSNAISFVATQTDNKYRALELERLAGKAMK